MGRTIAAARSTLIAPRASRSAALLTGCVLAFAPAAVAQIAPPEPALDYLPLDFGNASTFLTGVRGANIVGNSVIPVGQTGGLHYDSASGDWSAFPVATDNQSNYPGAIGSSPYGPVSDRRAASCVVGSYKTDEAPIDLGYLYDGAAAIGTDRRPSSIPIRTRNSRSPTARPATRSSATTTPGR